MKQTVGKTRFKGGPDGIAPIYDHGAPALFSDIVTEIEEVDGIIRLTFATLSRNGDGVEKAVIAVRLRMPKDVAWQLCRDMRALEEK
ncbi:hypothetical protein [Sinorhizobium fredii]|uniref:Uncharacterized protein n=1 Tax=Rhizobium fredii TaxID=380 RepID=A0A2L0H4I9_RHIFR|nr:hypothetical protein [Sinorhizobium fredii]AUX76378.1 hypothetical protein NXT3_CH01810 [Sinorhizobium fredii]